MSFQEDFWRDVRQLGNTIGAMQPFNRSETTALIVDFNSSTYEMQQQMRRDLRMLIDRLIQIDCRLESKLDACV